MAKSYEKSGSEAGPEVSRMLLAIFAHPDDETFTAGGTLALHAVRGWQVKLLCVTRGEGGRAGRGGLPEAAYRRLRVAELRQAAERLGIDEVLLWDWGDGRVARRNSEIAVSELLAVMLRLRPVLVITFGPDGISGHPDHVALSQFVTKAFEHYKESLGGAPVTPRLYYVVGSSGIPKCCRRNQKVTPAPAATTAVDISSVWQKKLAAMQAYQSQAHLLTGLLDRKGVLRAQTESFYRSIPRYADQDGVENDRVENALLP